MTALLHDWIRRSAAERPSAGAVVLGKERLTYRELDEQSDRVAQALRSLGVAPGDRICILAPKEPRTIVAMCGALKAGVVHVPLDTDSPPRRLAQVIDAVDCRWIFAGVSAAKAVDELFLDGNFGRAHGVFWLGERPAHSDVGQSCEWHDLMSLPAEPLPLERSSDDAAHILFTSGSTGVPKGVVITHANVIAFVNWAIRHFGITHDDRHSGHPPLHFDLSTFDIFGTFAAGAELHLMPPDLSYLPHKLTHTIRDSELTQFFAVPSLLNYVATFDALKGVEMPRLKRLLWCGEVLPTPALTYWMEHVPHATFTNLYGPTEATIASAFHTVARAPATADEVIPIGVACEGEELLVLDENLRPVADEDVGELFIRGVGLSPGYWRQSDLTAHAFLPWPAGGANDRVYRTGDLAWRGADGLFRYVGRTDSQVKTRGHRVELGDVEAGLHATGLVRECVVVGIPGNSVEGTVLCCAFTAVAETAPPIADVRSTLATHLPRYMIPARWSVMDALPRTGNGKIDRRRIREMFTEEVAATVS